MKRLSLHGSDTVLLSPFIMWKYYQEIVILYREQGTRKSHFFGRDGMAASAKLSLPHLWDKVILSYDACEEKHNACCSTTRRSAASFIPVLSMATRRASKRRITSCTTGCARTCCSSASVVLRAVDGVSASCCTLRFCFLRMISSRLLL